MTAPKPAVDLEAMAGLAEKATPKPDTGHSQTCRCRECSEVWAHSTRLAPYGAELARTFVPSAIEELRELRAEVAEADETIRLTQEAMDGWRERAEKAQADLAACQKAATVYESALKDIARTSERSEKWPERRASDALAQVNPFTPRKFV